MNKKFKDPFHAEILPVPNLDKRPLWSVVIPTYNCAKYLRQTLNSVLKQFPDSQLMEIIVVDDCSNEDNPELVVEEFQAPITFYRQPINVGKTENYATGIKISKGEYIHLLHGDDFVNDGFYKKMEDLFGRHPKVGAAFCHCHYINEHNKVIGQTEILANEEGILDNFEETIAIWQRIQPPSIVFKREVYEMVGGYDQRLKYIEDWEFYVRASVYFKFAYTPKTLANYRVFEGNSSSQSIKGGKRVGTIDQVIKIMNGYLPATMARRIKDQRNYAASVYLLNYIPYLINSKDLKGFFVVSMAFFKYNNDIRLWGRWLRFIFQYRKFLKIV